MDSLKTGRTFFALCMLVQGIHPLIYGDVRTVLIPPWPSWRLSPGVWVYGVGIAMIAAALCILFDKKGREVALILGASILALGFFWHLPYLFFGQPNDLRHFGLWAQASKALALSGGAFVVAGSFSEGEVKGGSKLIQVLEKIIPMGPIFFSITMIEFGIDHFLYTEPISTLVPAWIPWPIFWTYAAGAALIGSGTAIILKIQLKVVAMLLAIMIFIWLIVLHIPRAIVDPMMANGNEVVSAADALGFSGTALMISRWVRPAAAT